MVEVHVDDAVRDEVDVVCAIDDGLDLADEICRVVASGDLRPPCFNQCDPSIFRGRSIGGGAGVHLSELEEAPGMRFVHVVGDRAGETLLQRPGGTERNAYTDVLRGGVSARSEESYEIGSARETWRPLFAEHCFQHQLTAVSIDDERRAKLAAGQRGHDA